MPVQGLLQEVIINGLISASSCRGHLECKYAPFASLLKTFHGLHCLRDKTQTSQRDAQGPASPHSGLVTSCSPCSCPNTLNMYGIEAAAAHVMPFKLLEQTGNNFKGRLTAHRSVGNLWQPATSLSRLPQLRSGFILFSRWPQPMAKAMVTRAWALLPSAGPSNQESWLQSLNYNGSLTCSLPIPILSKDMPYA